MKQRSPLIFIFITIFVDLLGIGMILPLLPYYVKIVEQTSYPLLADNRALVVGALMASFSLMQFLFAPVLGAVSDRFGRRPVLLLSLLGTGIAYILLGVADSFIGYGASVVLAILFFARILDGITGGNISTAQAYIADITPPEDRAKGLGLIGAAFGLGFMLGPAFGGLLSVIDLNAPAFVAAAITFANVAFGYFMLPESLPAERRTRTPWIQMNPVNRLSGVIGNQSIRPLLLAIVLLNFAFAGLQNNFPVFSDERFGFSPLDNALIFAFIGFIAVVMQGFLLRKLVPQFGEARLTIAGLTLMTMSFGLIANVPEAWMLYPTVGILVMGSSMATPSITSLISRRVSANEQGVTLGGTQAITSLMMVFGPLYAGFVFDAVGMTAPYMSGVVLVAAGTLLMAVTLWPEIVGRTPVSRPTMRLDLDSASAGGQGD